ncbi:hypothetical protein FACS189462_0590 [Spirochaetia bacterium]|nr:hypothetical protein FACS189462_0590 [Spirochaetia bacterium]
MGGNKDDEKINCFLSQVGMKLGNGNDTKLTLSKIKNVLPLIQYELEAEEIGMYGEPIWQGKIRNKNNDTCYLWTENYLDDNTEIESFEVIRGSEPYVVIELFKYLSNNYGRFLFCCDGGNSTIISMEKTVEENYKELFD